MSVPKSVLSIPEFCPSIGIHRTTLSSMAAVGDAPPVIALGVAGRRKGISVAAAEAWLAKREARAAA